ncbi:MAG: hypothetical protein AAGI67_12820 [Pseudomonadota bacterium]
MIWPLINGFVDICLLRRSPADLPASQGLAVVTTGVYLLLDLIAGRIVSPAHFPTQSLVSLLLSLLALTIILRLAGMGARFTQTWTAFTGCGALIYLVVLPLHLSIPHTTEATPVDPLTGIAFLFLLAWSFVVEAHIFRHALNVTFTAGFALATLTFALLAVIRALIFP